MTNGNLLWKFTAGSEIHFSPVIKDGKVFVGSIDNGLYCLNEVTGDLLWNTGTEVNMRTSPTVQNDKVLTVLGEVLVCIEVGSGTQLWSVILSNGHSSPTFYNGRVFIRTDYSSNNTLFCLDSLTGTLVWKYQTEGSIQATPVVANGKVFIGDRGNTGRVYCLNAQDCSLIWKHAYEDDYGAEYSSAAVANGKVVLCMGLNFMS